MSKSHLVAKSPSRVSILLLLGLLMATLTTTGAQIGVCYGTVANNLPPAQEVISLYNQYNIQRMRLYGPNHDALQALRGSNIEVVLGVENERLQDISSSQDSANDWVQNNVVNYNDVKFKYIAVGNEINATGPDAPFVGPAMERIQNAVSTAGLANQIKVSTAVYPIILEKSYPPSKGSFRQNYRPFLDPIIGFLVGNQSPLLVNMYPYFSYIQSRDISLEYALFTSASAPVKDGDLQYQNLFDAILDAVYSALEKAAGGSLKIVVSESGWPSDGGDGQVTTKENARIYNSNLIKHVKGGTPKKPGNPSKLTCLACLMRMKNKGRRLRSISGSFFLTKSPYIPLISTS